MKTFSEVAEWMRGAAEQFGDPSVPVAQLFVRWRGDMEKFHRDEFAGELRCGMLDGEFAILLGRDLPPLPLPVELDGPKIGEEGELQAFGAELVTPGVWALNPSLNAQGLIHAFIVLYGVPDPAPWERRIVLP